MRKNGSPDGSSTSTLPASDAAVTGFFVNDGPRQLITSCGMGDGGGAVDVMSDSDRTLLGALEEIRNSLGDGTMTSGDLSDMLETAAGLVASSDLHPAVLSAGKLLFEAALQLDFPISTKCLLAKHLDEVTSLIKSMATGSDDVTNKLKPTFGDASPALNHPESISVPVYNQVDGAPPLVHNDAKNEKPVHTNTTNPQSASNASAVNTNQSSTTKNLNSGVQLQKASDSTDSDDDSKPGTLRATESTHDDEFSPTNTTEHLQRVPGEKPHPSDLDAVIFSPLATFEVGETVIIPRSKGGFTYGVVVKFSEMDKCYLDTTCAHPWIRWRVSYPNEDHTNFYKEMPAAYIGKLPALLLPSVHMKKQRDRRRRIGLHVNPGDLAAVVFNPASQFCVGQLVVVPRSAGGFTYGSIVGMEPTPCTVDSHFRHDVMGCRVFVSPEGATPVWKDIHPGNIGAINMSNSHWSKTPEATSPKRPLKIVISKNTKFVSPQGVVTSPPQQPTPSSMTAPPMVLPQSMYSMQPSYGVNMIYSSSMQTAYPVANTTALGPSPTAVSPAPMATKMVSAALPNSPTQLHSHGGIIELPHPHSFVTNTGGQSRNCKIVLDGPNVAMKHGNQTHVSVAGLNIAIKYWKARNHDTVAFIPQHYLLKAKTSAADTNGGLVPSKKEKPKIDDPELLQKLVNQELVVLTPPQDYDDSYTIKWAMDNNACIVTNDRYWDHIDKSGTDKPKVKKWLRNHCISFTFVRDEFLPNPDFRFPAS
ncbi:ribonuclease zc3h12d [Pelomyxa schiedti]|nr:ribonuclease zc3h12d [Pelomyxa schiedti]